MSVAFTVAARMPAAVGANATLKVQVGAGQVEPVIVKSDALNCDARPGVAASVTVTPVALLADARVNAPAALAPQYVSALSCEQVPDGAGGVSARLPPVPPMLTASESVFESTTVSWASRRPVTVGLNATLIVQLAPALRVVAQRLFSV